MVCAVGSTDGGGATGVSGVSRWGPQDAAETMNRVIVSWASFTTVAYHAGGSEAANWAAESKRWVGSLAMALTVRSDQAVGTAPLAELGD